jgi:hypothetical protein
VRKEENKMRKLMIFILMGLLFLSASAPTLALEEWEEVIAAAKGR